MTGLSLVTPLAYDWKYAFAVIRSYYDIADEIILGLDALRISWSHKPFTFDNRALAEFLTEVDTHKKIRIIEGNFHAHPIPIQNDTLERRQLGLACRPGNWVVQIDSDELLLNPLDLRDFMQTVPQDVAIWARLIHVYKMIGNKALVVGGVMEKAPIATRLPQRYQAARDTRQPHIVSPLHLLHLTWCRTEEELVQKLTHWGHSPEIDLEKTVGLWRSTTLENYHERRNFHYLHGPLWPCLSVMELPASPLSREITFKLAPDVWRPSAQASRIIIEGATQRGGLHVTFTPPQPHPKAPPNLPQSPLQIDP